MNSSCSRSCGFSIFDFSLLHFSRAETAPFTVLGLTLEVCEGGASCSSGCGGDAAVVVIEIRV
ncbi:hypothetical protein F2Q68_00026157 [Brassica cretica]|uniref:Uncharacterized protein n=1 Tax=Brassica cretica TaxID=69181 RepID=A0A8S9I7V0_BRACR|nr:hypothetical protein F2Q68_00026157 [Brassica cretica]